MLLPALFLALQIQAPTSPRTVVLEATRAVEADSGAAFRARWTDRLTRDSTDRAARLALATLARLTYAYDRAQQEYAGLEAGTDAYALYARIGHGLNDIWRESFDTSAARFAAAADFARALGDSAAAAAALTALGFLQSRLGPLTPALETLAEAQRLAPEREVALRGRILCTGAPILSFAGHQEAHSTGEQGLALARQAADLRTVGLCYHALAMVADNDESDPVVMDAYTDSAAAAQRAARDGPMLAITLYTRGYGRYISYDLAGAKRAFGESIAEGEASGCPFAVAWSRRYLAAVSWAAGDAVSSEQEFGAAEAIFTRLDDGFGLSNARLGRATALFSLGRVDEAEPIFRKHLARAEQNGVAEGVYINRFNLASVRMARGDWAGARSELEGVIAYGRAHGHAGWAPSLDYELGLSSLRLGELDRAGRQFRAYLANIGPEQYLDRYAIRSRLAEVAVEQGRLDVAVTELESAAGQLDSLRNSLQDQQLKLLIFQIRDTYEEPDLGLATVAAALVRGGRATDAFRLVEHRRARTLADQLLRAAFLRGDSAPSNLVNAGGLPDVGALQAALPDDSTALLEYYGGRWGQPSTVFVLTRTALTGAVLPSLDSLGGDLDRYLALLERGEPATAAATRLSARLLLPALAGLPAAVQRVMLVPDDRLHEMPFDALPLSDGQPLISRYSMSRAPSAVIAVRHEPRSPRRMAPTLLALGDPRFPGDSGPSPDPATEIYRSAFAQAGGLPRLTASRAEANAVARFAPGAVLRLGDDASEAFLKHAPLADFQVIHFATHALVDQRASSRTALALAPGGGEDGFLGADEVGQLALDADLVVLSACRTAGGAVVGGEGVQGLTAPLLAAGARAVVATLWPIGDRHTAELVEDFYREVAAGARLGEALRTAKLAAHARGESPAVWAAFTLVGDADIRIPLVAPRPRWPLWTAALTILAGVLGWVRLRRPLSAELG